MNQNIKKQILERIERKYPNEISLSIAQAAEAIGKKKNTLNVWRSRKTGPPYIKIAGGIRYPIDDLAEFMANQIIHTS